MKKQLLVVIMILALSFSMIGCSKTNESSESENAGNVESNVLDNEETSTSTESTEKRKFYSMGTAGTGGAYYPIGIAIANILSNDLGIQTSAKVTGGAAENNVLLNDGTVELAITQGPIAYAALNGTAPYSNENTNVMALFNGLSKGVFHVVVMGDSGITSFADLEGKSIAMGPAGGGAINVALDVLSKYDLGLDDIKPTYLSYSEGVDALKDGNVDVAIIQSAAPAAAVTQLAATTKDFRIISIEDDKLKEILNDFPYYSSIEIPSDMYGNNSDAITIYLSNMVVVSKELSEDEVYEMTKAIFENIDKIHESHPSAKGLTIEGAVDRVPIPLHPGAEKYYIERGLLK